jgi:hypothetical protein
MTVGLLRFGDAATREVSKRIAGYFATTTALAALAAVKRVNGMLAVVGQTIYVFDSAATSGGVTPDAGTGRWIPASETAQNCAMVRVATAAPLPANTRSGSVLTANANGALNDTGVDGIADLAVGNVVLVKDEVAGANNGIYVVTALGGASAKWTFTRHPAMDASAEVKSGMLVVSSEGTAGPNSIWMLTTNDPITINTTALTFASTGTATASDATPKALGVAAAGTSPNFSRADHVHATVASDATPAALGTAAAGTSAECSRADHVHATIMGKRTVTIGHANLTDAVNGEAQAINLQTALPPNAMVFAHALTDITPFSGGSVSACKLDVGGTDADAIVNALELIADAPTEAELIAAAGLLPQGQYSAQQLTATFTPDAGHALSALDAGSITITVWYQILA